MKVDNTDGPVVIGGSSREFRSHLHPSCGCCTSS